MFDYAPVSNFPPTSKKLGVGMHPHRGFETVTIALEGEIDHRDSKGHEGTITTGGVQWMTAGSGIFHEEFHSRRFAKKGGPFSMMQLWVNLPARLKMVEPRYQGLNNEDFPVLKLDGDAGTIKLISGEWEGNKGPVDTDFRDEEGKSLDRGEIILWEVKLNPGATTELKIEEGHTTILFVKSGKLVINGNSKDVLGTPRIALMTRTGSSVELTSMAEDEETSVFVLGGAPHLDEKGQDEPIVSHGPMVMNTRQEINEAMQWAQKEQRKMYR